jgi:hypothetical protein
MYTLKKNNFQNKSIDMIFTFLTNWKLFIIYISNVWLKPCQNDFFYQTGGSTTLATKPFFFIFTRALKFCGKHYLSGTAIRGSLTKGKTTLLKRNHI